MEVIDPGTKNGAIESQKGGILRIGDDGADITSTEQRDGFRNLEIKATTHNIEGEKHTPSVVDQLMKGVRDKLKAALIVGYTLRLLRMGDKAMPENVKPVDDERPQIVTTQRGDMM